MTWRDGLQPASFRGVPFEVTASDVQEGRQWVTHKFPSRDRPLSEDLGLNPGQYSLEAYVIGDDYMAKRDALRAACNEEGPAELVHPYLGSLYVVCDGCRLREEHTKGRMARFQLVFSESGEDLPPTEDEAALAEEAAAAAIEESQSFLESVMAAVKAVNEWVQGLITAIGEVAEYITDLVSDFLDPLVDLIAAPFLIAEAITSAVARVEAAFESRLAAANVYLDWARATFGSTPRDRGTFVSQQNIANVEAIRSHFRITAAAKAVELAAEVPWESYEQAKQYADDLQEALDELAEETPSDAVYQVVTALAAVLARVVPAVTEQLPRLRTVTPRGTVPSLRLAYQVYGEPDLEPDLVARNRPPHPAFVLGGSPVEVLVS